MTPKEQSAAATRLWGSPKIFAAVAVTASLLAGAATAGDCTPDAMYGPRVNWETRQFPAVLKSADLDADGNQDLYGVADSNYVFVFFGRGDGTFLPPVERGLGIGFILTCSAGDLDGDGDLDVVVGGVASASSDDLGVWMNNGDRTFADPDYYDLPSDRGDLAMGDVDGDGDLDVVAVGSALGNAPVVVMRNDSTGVLSSTTNYPGSVNAVGVRMGDIGNDGDLDFVVTFQTATFSAYINFGDGVFARSNTLSTFDPVTTMAYTQYDLDGNPDLIVGSPSTQTIRIYRGRPDGTWFAPAILPIGLSVDGLDTQDVNGDGYSDLVVTANATEQCAVFYNDGANGVGSPGLYTTGVAPTSPALGDFDNDGDFDLAYANFSSDGTIGVRLNLCIVRPSIATHPVSTAVDAGDAIVLGATLATGTQPLDYQWLRNGSPIADDGRVSGSQTATLTIDPAQAGDSDEYAVQVSNDGGTVVSHTAFVAVRGGGGGSDCIADLNNDGLLDFFDVQAYLNAFSAGCP